jgi:hypothetical protein
MASSRRIGVGTTFVILSISFSGGLMLGKHAWTRQLPSGAMDRARTALLMRFWSACGVAENVAEKPSFQFRAHI